MKKKIVCDSADQKEKGALMDDNWLIIEQMI